MIHSDDVFAVIHYLWHERMTVIFGDFFSLSIEHSNVHFNGFSFWSFWCVILLSKKYSLISFESKFWRNRIISFQTFRKCFVSDLWKNSRNSWSTQIQMFYIKFLFFVITMSKVTLLTRSGHFFKRFHIENSLSRSNVSKRVFQQSISVRNQLSSLSVNFNVSFFFLRRIHIRATFCVKMVSHKMLEYANSVKGKKISTKTNDTSISSNQSISSWALLFST